MVVAPADHGTQADVMFVIEGTAINGAYMNDLKTNYVLPTLEYFSQGALEDYVCESTSTMYGLVVYQASDCLPNPSSDCYGPYSSPQKVLHMLDRIELIGGKGESHANIAEGLATALQCFEDLQQRRDNTGISQKHCILVCHSPPYQLPVVDSPAFAGNTVDQLANILAERGINLSILSPRKIPALFKLYEKAGGDLQASQTKNYAKDPRHLVLLKGYNLKERPISPGPGSAPGAPAHPNSLPLPSISSPLPSTGSPVATPQAQTVFRQTQQAPQVMGISQAQPNPQQQVAQQQQQVAQQQQQQQQQQQVQQQVSQQQAQQQVTQLQVVQQQQQQVQQQVTQQQMANQQQVPTSGVPQGLGAQGRAPGPQPYPQQGPPSYPPQMMSNRPPGRWPMMPPQRAQFPTTSGGSALIAQLTQPPSMGPQFNILGQTQGGLNQQQQANQQVQQQTAQQVQQQQAQQQAQQQQSNQQQPQSVQQQTNQQQAQSVQQQTNQQQPQSVQQQQAQQQQAQQQVQLQAGGMRMIAQQNGPQPGTLGSLGPQQVSVPVSSSAPGQPVQPGPPLVSVPSLGTGPGPVIQQPAGRERQTIWQGVLEWIEKAKMPSDNQKQTRHVPCQVSANAKDGEPELKADNWPQKLIMQLMPKQLIGNIGGAYLKNSKSVLFHPQQCEALDSLTKVMSSGFAGCVHFTSVISPSACDIKVLILLYTAEKRAYLGFIPNDQAAFVDRLRKVIQHQKSTQAMMRQGQGGAAGQPGVPNGPMNPGQPGNLMGNSMGQQGGPLGGGMNPQQGGAGGLGQLGGPLGSQAPGQIGGLLNSQLQGGLGGMNPQQGSALSNALGGNQVGGAGQGGAGTNPGGGASGLMQAMAGVGNAGSQNQTPPQTPAGQQPPTSLGIQGSDQARAAAAAAAVAAAAAGQGGAPGGLMGQRPPFGIEVARQENLAKIQHLRKTLEQAQAQELQYKNQLEIISHMKIQQLQQSLENAQQQEVQYKSQLEQEQQKQLRAQLQQIQQQRGMAPQQVSQGGPGGPAGGAQPGGPTAPQQQRMMRPGISNNPGLRHLLQQQQPQYRQQVLSMNPQQMPRTQQGIPNPQQSQQQFDEASFDFLN